MEKLYSCVEMLFFVAQVAEDRFFSLVKRWHVQVNTGPSRFQNWQKIFFKFEFQFSFGYNKLCIVKKTSMPESDGQSPFGDPGK